MHLVGDVHSSKSLRDVSEFVCIQNLYSECIIYGLATKTRRRHNIYTHIKFISFYTTLLRIATDHSYFFLFFLYFPPFSEYKQRTQADCSAHGHCWKIRYATTQTRRYGSSIRSSRSSRGNAFDVKLGGVKRQT